MKVRDIIKLVEMDGWYLVKIVGSHRQYQHREKSGRVTIAGHPNDDVHPKTLASIFKQAQLRK
jgi:predicted RNA binding protein YcfA (HicA-like mRNA interferase family)